MNGYFLSRNIILPMKNNLKIAISNEEVPHELVMQSI
jgi:hypothetical protein